MFNKMDILKPSRIGGSIALFIPPKYLEAVDYKPGDYFTVQLVEDCLIFNKLVLPQNTRRFADGQSAHGP
jgi:antitoxin component of MazEF toxin-antitoxin module